MQSPTHTIQDMSSNSINKRRARNRVSQKSFRERQALYVKQLESQLADRSSSESTRIREVQQENDKLRHALLAARKRILGLTTALSGVTDNIGIALGFEGDSFNSKPQSRAKERHVNTTTGDPEENADGVVDQQILPPLIDTQSHQEHPIGDVLSSSLQSLHRTNTQNALHWPVDAGLSFDLDMNSLGIWQSPGAQADIQYNISDIASTSLEPSTSLQRRVLGLDNLTLSSGEARITADIRVSFPPGNAKFPSTFSAHLAACEFFIKQNRAYKQRHAPGGSEGLSKLISNMVNMFVNTAWPDMRVWWAYLQSSSTVEKIMRWRLDPNLESYQALPICHRPTTTQLCTLHPTIIDWGFFPSVRDRLIELYSYSSGLDQLMCELLGSYVVEADLSNFMVDLQEGLPKKGYFRIWDLVETISKEDPVTTTSAPFELHFWQDGQVPDMAASGPPSPFEIDEDENPCDWTPIPLEEVYHSKKAAEKLFRLLHMDDRQYAKLDPVFALNHPELCDDPTILATGLDCTIKGRIPEVPLAKPLTRETILNYKMMLWKSSVT